MTAIILDGHLKSALAAVRSLGRKNITLYVGAERKTGMALHSKYTTEFFTYISPLENQKLFIEALKKKAGEVGGRPVVYAFSDATWLSLYKYRNELSQYVTLAYPDSDAVEIAFDKSSTDTLAHTVGVETIPTEILHTETELEQYAEKATYPVVLKNRKSVTWKKDTGVFGTAVFIHSKEELKEKYGHVKKRFGEAPLIQEFILGKEYGVEMLARDGEVYAQIVHKRLTSLSPTGGASVLKQTVVDGELKNELIFLAEKLVERLSWTGPIMVEFKVDEKKKKTYLMEINGRFWGSLPLSIAAGVDMPYLYFQDVCENKRPSEVVKGMSGVTTNHFMGSILHLVRVLTKSDPMRKIVYPKRLESVVKFLFLPKGTRGDVWSFNDPMPAVWEIIDIVKKLWR